MYRLSTHFDPELQEDRAATQLAGPRQHGLPVLIHILDSLERHERAPLRGREGHLLRRWRTVPRPFDTATYL